LEENKKRLEKKEFSFLLLFTVGHFFTKYGKQAKSREHWGTVDHFCLQNYILTTSLTKAQQNFLSGVLKKNRGCF